MADKHEDRAQPTLGSRHDAEVKAKSAEAEKSHAEQIASHEEEIRKLEEKAAELRRKAAFQEFPKWIPDPTDPTGQRGTTVNSAEEEKAVVDGHVRGQESADTKRKSDEIRAKEKVDEDSAKALRDEADAHQKARAKGGK